MSKHTIHSDTIVDMSVDDRASDFSWTCAVFIPPYICEIIRYTHIALECNSYFLHKCIYTNSRDDEARRVFDLLCSCRDWLFELRHRDFFLWCIEKSVHCGVYEQNES